MLEGLTGGAMANTYIISNKDRQIQVAGRESKTIGEPLFIVKEESNCCTRICCSGNQTLVARFYWADPQVKAGKTYCSICYTGDQYLVDNNLGVAMTMDRKGCCTKCIGCLICTDGCRDDAYMHMGDAQVSTGKLVACPRPALYHNFLWCPFPLKLSHQIHGGQTKSSDTNYFGRSVQAPHGGGFTPTFFLGDQINKADPGFATVKGPTFYGGWLGLCFDTIFKISSNAAPNSADVGTLSKRRAETMTDMCREQCSNADVYDLKLGEQFDKLTPEQQATVIGHTVHLDYRFFENDRPPCSVKMNDDNKSGMIICLLCQAYCYGLTCPFVRERRGAAGIWAHHCACRACTKSPCGPV